MAICLLDFESYRVNLTNVNELIKLGLWFLVFGLGFEWLELRRLVLPSLMSPAAFVIGINRVF